MKYAGRGEELFGDLEVWKDPELRKEQGAWPVIFLSFADIKFTDFATTKAAVNGLIAELFYDFRRSAGYDGFDDTTRRKYDEICEEMPDNKAARSLNFLCSLLEMLFPCSGFKITGIP